MINDIKLSPINKMNKNGWKYTEKSFEKFPESVPLVIESNKDSNASDLIPGTVVGEVVNLRIQDGYVMGDLKFDSIKSEEEYKKKMIPPRMSFVGRLDPDPGEEFVFVEKDGKINKLPKETIIAECYPKKFHIAEGQESSWGE